jgi:hypothetical protein
MSRLLWSGTHSKLDEPIVLPSDFLVFGSETPVRFAHVVVPQRKVAINNDRSHRNECHTKYPPGR